jgi:hypothetical protein
LLGRGVLTSGRWRGGRVKANPPKSELMRDCVGINPKPGSSSYQCLGNWGRSKSGQVKIGTGQCHPRTTALRWGLGIMSPYFRFPVFPDFLSPYFLDFLVSSKVQDSSCPSSQWWLVLQIVYPLKIFRHRVSKRVTIVGKTKTSRRRILIFAKT